jgi:hypothetical protein
MMMRACLTLLLFGILSGQTPADDKLPTARLVETTRLVETNDKPDAQAKETLAWESAAGRGVRIDAPQLTLTEPKTQAKLPLTVVLTKHAVQGDQAVLDYALHLNEYGFVLSGTATLKIALPEKDDCQDILIARLAVSFAEPVKADVETACGFHIDGTPARQMGLPERNGYFRVWPLSAASGGAGRFELGQAARGPVACSELGLPVVGLIFDDKDARGPYPPPMQLAVAADPYCGSYFQAQAEKTPAAGKIQPGTCVTIRTTYHGSIVPLRCEERTFVLEFHRLGTDGTLRVFYRTIPEIEPGAAWTQGIHLVYYDYLSEKGEGWFKDLKTLAGRIPPQRRGRVAVCLHGWYDYFQHYAYDHQQRKLLDHWTAFPGTYKVPMSLAEMHRRLKFAKDLGFRVLLYFSDGTNSDSGAPNFEKEFVLKDKHGRTFPGWKGPDSLGQPLMMDPSVPGLRDWYRGYLKALLDEYAKDLDGLVWDETMYIPTNFISYGHAEPAYADRAMMGLVAEMTRLVQSYHKVNPELVFLASDCGATNYALVAHGTYQDTGMREAAWGPSMFANYRNCLWSCNWSPLHRARENEIAADKYGLPQALTNGWEDNCGPNRMPPVLLDAVLARFNRNVDANRQRLRYLTPLLDSKERP